MWKQTQVSGLSEVENPVEYMVETCTDTVEGTPICVAWLKQITVFSEQCGAKAKLASLEC